MNSTEQKLIENWQEFVTPKQMKKKVRLIREAKEHGSLRWKDGQFLLNIEHKIRRCPSCGMTSTETPFRIIEFLNKFGQMIPCGLAKYCYECEVKLSKEKMKEDTKIRDTSITMSKKI